MTTSLRRSALYLPASNPRAIAKARTLDCDAVILDLEDAVAPSEKAAARAAAVAAAHEGGFGARTLAVRVNGLDTAWGADDLAAVADAGFDAVLAPKVGSAADVRDYAARIGATRELWVMIETCRSLFALEAIAAEGSAEGAALTSFVLGTNDLAKEMRAPLDAGRAPFLPLISFAVAAARLHGLTVLDGVHNDIDDEAGFLAACAQSLAWGLDGRTLIHPRQIDPCNRAFTPGPGQAAQAQRIVDAFARPENAAAGAIRLDGRMVERLHLAEAERTLALHRAAAR